MHIHTEHRTGTAFVVLLVEDDALIRTLTSEFLRDSGCTVLEASDVAGALKILAKDSVDLVFSDYNLPGQVNGLNLAGWVGAHLPKTPILLTSGRLPELDGFLNRSDRRFLPKPYQFDRLQSEITSMISASRS